MTLRSTRNHSPRGTASHPYLPFILRRIWKPEVHSEFRNQSFYKVFVNAYVFHVLLYIRIMFLVSVLTNSLEFARIVDAFQLLHV